MNVIPAGARGPVLWQTVRWLARPIPMLEDCARRYGDVFTMRLPAAVIVLFSHPAAIKDIFTGDPETLRGGEANVVLEPSSQRTLDVPLPLFVTRHDPPLQTAVDASTSPAWSTPSRATPPPSPLSSPTLTSLPPVGH